MAYATVAELTAYLGNGYTLPNAQQLLDRASRDIDALLICATYTTDSGGNATDTAVITALHDATLEQVVYHLEQGNESGVRHGLQAGVPSGASAGEVSLSRGQSAGGDTETLPRWGEQVVTILRTAGLLGEGPISQ